LNEKNQNQQKAEDEEPRQKDGKGAAAKKPSRKQKQEEPKNLYQQATRLIVKIHGHPISTHSPNGVLPMALLFFFTACVLNLQPLANAALYALIFVVIAMPGVLYTGYLDWQARFKGHLVPAIKQKITAGAAVLSMGLILAGWRALMPEITEMESPWKWGFLAGLAAMTAPAVYAGYVGGKLVFKE